MRRKINISIQCLSNPFGSMCVCVCFPIVCMSIHFNKIHLFLAFEAFSLSLSLSSRRTNEEIMSTLAHGLPCVYVLYFNAWMGSVHMSFTQWIWSITKVIMALRQRNSKLLLLSAYSTINYVHDRISVSDVWNAFAFHQTSKLIRGLIFGSFPLPSAQCPVNQNSFF